MREICMATMWLLARNNPIKCDVSVDPLFEVTLACHNGHGSIISEGMAVAKVARELKRELSEVVLAEIDSQMLLLYVKGPLFLSHAQERL